MTAEFRPTRRDVLLGAAALASLVLVGVPVGSVLAADDPTFTLVIKDHKFTPSEIEVPANTKVKLIIKNEDSTAEEFDSKALKREKVIAGGKEGIVNIGPLKPGRYEFIGEFHAKTARGAVIVK